MAVVIGTMFVVIKSMVRWFVVGIFLMSLLVIQLGIDRPRPMDGNQWSTDQFVCARPICDRIYYRNKAVRI